jgi:AcrR family transcriptional regulator
VTSAPLTRDRVVDEALAIADTDGFEALSLRAVARRLGVTPMALYRYVESSNELADLVVSRVVEEHVSAVAWPDDPREALRRLATSVARLIREHPTMLERYEQGGVFTEPAKRVVDRVLAVLCAAGLTGPEAVRAYVTVHYYALGFAALSGKGTVRQSSPPDPEELPVLAEHFEAWTDARDETELSAGLELVIDAVLGTR